MHAAGHHIGVVAALPAEGAALLGRRAAPGTMVKLPEGGWLHVCGIGGRRAGDGARALLEAGAGALVSFGVAAGLDAALRPGCIVLPEAVAACDGSSVATDSAWRARVDRGLSGRVPTVGGTLAEAAELLRAAEEKAALRARSGAVAADMESAAVARLAGARGIALLVVRAVADHAALTVPVAARMAVDADGRIHPGRALRALAARPRDLRALWGLGLGFRAALRSLELAGAVLRQVPCRGSERDEDGCGSPVQRR